MTTGRILEDLASRITHASNATSAGAIVGHDFLIPNAATADYDIVLDEKFEVVDVIVRKDGAGAANTAQIKTGAGVAITDAIIAAVDKVVTRAGTIDSTGGNNVIAAGGTLRCTFTRAAGTSAALVTVLGFCRP
jgi:hypothetical protein